MSEISVMIIFEALVFIALPKFISLVKLND